MADQPAMLRTQLDNGLDVIIRRVPRVPVASFWLWYGVGARNEVPGITGVSHWVEHMLFKGTPDWGVGQIFRTINKHGGTLNGFTWIDYTAYFETLPSAKIGIALDIEADRMRNAVFDPAEVESERTVILSEREGNENQPTFFLREEVNAAAFRAHPYGQGVIGFKSDLQQITREDLYRHYRTYYVPNNATAVVVGDVRPEAMLAEIERRFGGIEPGGAIPPVRTVEPPQEGERRVVLRRPAPARTLLLTWHAPNAVHPDAPAMVVLDTVLSGGKGIGFGGGGGMGRSSRLYRRLVAGGLASSAGSSFALTTDPYLFSVSATLLPTSGLDQVESVVLEEIERLRSEPVPAAELERAIKQLRAQFAYAGESVTSQAYWLGSLQTVAPGFDPDEYIERITSVTAEDVTRVAATYLSPAIRTAGWLDPVEATAGASTPAEPAAAYRPHYFSDGGLQAAPQLGLRERRLANGIHLVGHHDPSSDAAVVEMRIAAGAIADGDLPGLARFTGQTLARGTRRRGFDELNEELDALGAAIGVNASREYVDVSGKSLKEDVARLVELMAEIVLEPSFPEEEIKRVRGQSLNALRQALDDTRAVAGYGLRASIYPPGHPYHHRTLGTEATLTAIGRDDLRRFHGRAYRPDRAIVATAGGVPVDAVWELVERVFGGWTAGGPAPEIDVPDVEPPAARIRREARLAGKSQADIAIGLPALRRSNPDYDALRTANLILGRLGLMGRLGASVRERQGMAYYASSSLDAGLARGLWTAAAGVNPANIDRAIDSILEEVERLRREPVEDEELADAKSYLIGSLPLGLESSDAVAGTALSLIFYDLGIDYVERLPERVHALTAEALRQAAERYLLTERMAISIARPALPG